MDSLDAIPLPDGLALRAGTEAADGFYEHLDFRPFKGYRKSYF